MRPLQPRLLAPAPTGLFIRVRLTPRAGRDSIEGSGATAEGDTFLKARVRAVPENNAANLALEKLVAGAFGVAKTKVMVIAGETARMKTLRIAGDRETLALKYRSLLKALVRQPGVG